MPKQNSKLKIRDPFVMNEDQVNESVANFLKEHGFNTHFLTGRSKGIDVEGSKNGWEIFVESKGSHANDHDNDTVFQTKQIKTHTYVQIGKLMEYKNRKKSNALFAMANPDIPRIRNRVDLVKDSLDILGFIRLWIQADNTVIVEYPNELNNILSSLKIVPNKKS